MKFNNLDIYNAKQNKLNALSLNKVNTNKQELVNLTELKNYLYDILQNDFDAKFENNNLIFNNGAIVNIALQIINKKTNS